ncbi:MAG: alpha-xylosidase, partial [Pedobacter sp.]|nr:alpha-xylosidase [Pedobacter sp.]
MVYLGSIFLCLGAQAQDGKDYVKTATGIEVTVQHSLTGIKKIRLQPVSEQIIHVTEVAANNFPEEHSLMSVKTNNASAQFTAKSENDVVSLKTSALNVEVSTQTGLITYRDLNNKLLLTQSKVIAPALTPKVFNGESSNAVTQIFDAQENEAYYGLGQHQEGIVNYRGRRVDLVQYNTEIAVPFFVSNKGYGILWDNYSITRAGDVRDYEPLSALRLFSKDDEQGWLTASYSLKQSPNKVLFRRPVSELSMNWLTDQHKFPDSIKMQDAIVNYEGSVASSEAGLYQFQLKYAGYIKIWFDGKLVA